MSFTHLQVKSGYSLMQSTNTVERLVKRASELQFEALALTDKHNLYGAIQFYQACEEHGIKPILGMTVNVVDQKEEEQCIVLAKNIAGYKQLCQISTYINRNKKQCIERDKFQSFVEDLICILQVSKGTFHSILANQTYDDANDYVYNWQKLFQQGDFYLGIEDHGLAQDRAVYETLKSFSNTFNIPVVASNDVRYIHEQDEQVYACLLAMKDGKNWTGREDTVALRNRHLRTTDEMNHLFAEKFPEAINNTKIIKQKCNVIFDFNQRLMPSFPVPETYNAASFLHKVCWENIENKYEKVTSEMKERLTYELNIIQSMGFSDYFLIVWDFVAFAKKSGILVGPGRGSAAGSLIAYVLGITEVDPIKYELLFERFLNPERQTMPDIDVDFSDHRREEVIDYVREKYGEDHVAQIITFGTFGVRSLLRELFKVMQIDDNDARFILSKTSTQTGKTIKEFVKQSDDLANYIKQSKQLRTLFNIAHKLEGLPRHMSTHAAGVVISEQPLIEHIPLTLGSNNMLITQYPMDDLEAVGLLKMDFLGLRNLTLLERIIQSINYSRKDTLSLSTIPTDNQKTYNLLQQGQTNGVFQLESQGMRQVLTRLKPTVFEDIVAANALFRPGPMDYIPAYIDRKHKREKVTYIHPDVLPILEKTYGVPVYQEQLMQIIHTFTNYSLGAADTFRRIISKQHGDNINEYKERFIKDSIRNGYDRFIAKQAFDLIHTFSKYGFNRSHAVAYSKISYQLAYLKSNYPAHFFVELLSSVTNQQEKIYAYIKEARSLHIKVNPPSINKSIGKYIVEQNNIRMGLLSIKGIGFQTVKEIIRARNQQPFKDLFDFCLRVPLNKINRRTIELLILAGAFDETYSNRASLIASIDQAMEQGLLFKEFSEQSSLLQDAIELKASYTNMEDFSTVKKLNDEKELLGLYISSHPLAEYRELLTETNYVTIEKATEMLGVSGVKSVGIIQSIKTIRTKRGDPMAFLTVGDETTDIDVVVFPELFRKTKKWLNEEETIILNGKIERRNNRIQYVQEHLGLFDEQELKETRQRLFIRVTKDSSKNALEVIREISSEFKGNIPVFIYDDMKKTTYKLAEKYYIHPSNACIQAFKSHFGNNNIVLN